MKSTVAVDVGVPPEPTTVPVVVVGVTVAEFVVVPMVEAGEDADETE